MAHIVEHDATLTATTLFLPVFPFLFLRHRFAIDTRCTLSDGKLTSGVDRK